MIRVLVIVALLFAAAAGVAWLAERPGEITLVWQGQEIRTSLMFGILMLAVAIAAIAFIGAVVRAVLSTPQSIGHFFGARRRAKGYRALTRGMVAVGAGDTRVAQRAARDARSYLGKDPLVTLLSAQAAQMTGDSAAARAAFEGLAADGETRLLGLRGLFIEARRQGEHTAARHFAEEAVKVAPRLPWAGEALFAYQTRSGDWEGALATLDINVDNGSVDKQQARRLRAVLETARAMELEQGSPDEARARASEAHRTAPDLVPAAVLSARLLARNGQIRRASRTLETTWKRAPHPDIAEAYLAVRPGDAARDRLKRAQKLFDLRPTHPESALVLARAAIDAREWALARTTLEGVLRAHPGERACLLMADLEEAENGDQGRARQWRTRSFVAPADPAWVADGQVFAQWLPVSPVSGEVDAMEWKAPSDRPSRFSTDMEIAAAAEAHAVPSLTGDSGSDGRGEDRVGQSAPMSPPRITGAVSGGSSSSGIAAGGNVPGSRSAAPSGGDSASVVSGGSQPSVKAQETEVSRVSSRGWQSSSPSAVTAAAAGGAAASASRAAGGAPASVPVPNAAPAIATAYVPEAGVATVPMPVPQADTGVAQAAAARVTPLVPGLSAGAGGTSGAAGAGSSAEKSAGSSGTSSHASVAAVVKPASSQGSENKEKSAVLPRPLTRAPDDPGPVDDEEDEYPPEHPLFHSGRIA